MMTGCAAGIHCCACMLCTAPHESHGCCVGFCTCLSCSHSTCDSTFLQQRLLDAAWYAVFMWWVFCVSPSLWAVHLDHSAHMFLQAVNAAPAQHMHVICNFATGLLQPGCRELSLRQQLLR
jgi:hypothetical protein